MDAREHPLWHDFVARSQKHRHHAFVVGHANLFVTQREAESKLLVLPWARYFQTLAECPDDDAAEDAPLDVTVPHPCQTLSQARALLLQGARHGGRWAWVQPAAVWKAFLSGMDHQGSTPEQLEQHGLRCLLQHDAHPAAAPTTTLPTPPVLNEPLLDEAVEVTVLLHGRHNRCESLHRQLRDLRCHATVRQQAPELTPVTTTRKPPGLLFPDTPELLAEGIRQAPEHQAYLEALHAARPSPASLPPDLRSAATACQQQLQQLAQEAAVLAQLDDPPMVLACLRLQHSVPVLPTGLLRLHTPELYPPISLPCAWETLSDWLQRQESEATVLLLLLFLYQQHDPDHRQQCLAMARLVLGPAALAPFVHAQDVPSKVCATDASWERIRSMQVRLIVHLQQKGIVYLIRRQQEDETPCCRPAKIVLTIDREEPCPAPLLPLPVPPRLASYLPSFTALPDDPTLVFTAHGFTVKRLDGLPGGALQALWVYANRELHKVRPGLLPVPAATESTEPQRSSCTELVTIYQSETTRQRHLQALQQQAEAQLRHTGMTFLEAYDSYQETCTELRSQQELLAQLHDTYVLQPQQPFCHHSGLLERLHGKMQWQQWFVRHEGQLACVPFRGPTLHRWYMQAHMYHVTEESQSLRTVTQHPDGTTVQHEAHSHRRSLQWKVHMLPELLHMSQELEQHYCTHQLRIDWLEYLLGKLHTMHQLLEQELHAHKMLVSQMSQAA